MSRQESSFEIEVTYFDDKIGQQALSTKNTPRKPIETSQKDLPRDITALSSEFTPQNLSSLYKSFSAELSADSVIQDEPEAGCYETPIKKSYIRRPVVPSRPNSSLTYSLELDENKKNLKKLPSRLQVTLARQKPPTKDFIAINKSLPTSRHTTAQVSLTYLLKTISKKSNHVSIPLYEKSQKQMQSAKRLKEQVESVTRSQCTFKPNICSKRPRRSVDEMLTQFNHSSYQSKQKLEILKASAEYQRKLNEVCSFAPKLNLNSMKIVSSRRQSSVLGQLGTNSARRSATPEPTYRPSLISRSVSLKRSCRIETLLYDDAKRRIERLKTLQPVEDRNVQANERSCSILSQKFLEEFKATFSQLDSENQGLLSLPSFKELMGRMKFVKQEADECLLDKAWRYIGAERSKSVAKPQLLKFLLLVMNLKPDRDATEPRDTARPELSLVHKVFYRFYHNRTRQVQHPKRPMEPEYSFKPHLVALSHAATHKAVVKREIPRTHGVSYADYLQNQLAEISSRAHELAAKVEAEMMLTYTFTTKLNEVIGTNETEATEETKRTEGAVDTNGTEGAADTNGTDGAEEVKIAEGAKATEVACKTKERLAMVGRTRSELLYSHAKKFQDLMTLKAKSFENVRLLNESQVCTFTPDTSKKPVDTSRPALVKGYSEAVERMRRARQDCEIKGEAQSTGGPSMIFELNRSKSSCAPRTQRSTPRRSLQVRIKSLAEMKQRVIRQGVIREVPESREPLVRFSITLTPEVKEELVVYSGDDIEKCLDQFAAKHSKDYTDLDSCKQYQLLEAMSHYLAQTEQH
jgi:hypothetical protein